MNKHQLIAGIIHDLGDENNGVQVRGYRNMNIIRTTIEALTALNQGLSRDDEANAALVAQQKETIEKLKAKLKELGVEDPEGEEVAPHDD